MRKFLVMALMAATALSVNAQDKKEEKVDPNKPVFTIVKENPITTVKNQNRSGTCWNYSTLSFFESEILKKTGKTYDLCEMFVCNKNYMERAITKVRMHGDAQFSQGGAFCDVLTVLKEDGICPEDAMPLPGTLYGDTLANFGEFFSIMEPYVDAVSKSNAKTLTDTWKKGFQGILDAYLGECPENFTYEGKTYTPKTFAESLGLDWNDYVSITSYTHKPFYTTYAIEVQDNWRQGLSWNLPMEEMARIIDHAVMNGYTIAWGGDVSGDGFGRTGLAILYDADAQQTAAGTDMDRWLGLSKAERQRKTEALGVNAKEKTPTQEMRQEEYNNWTLTDDHGMHLYGIAKDQTGRKYYMVKNSWGPAGDYKGIWYMSENFIVAKTMNFMVNKNAIPKDILKKMQKAQDAAKL